MQLTDLRTAILKEHSKAPCTKIVNRVGISQPRFDAWFVLFLPDEYRITQRAAWPVSCCVMVNPTFQNKHGKELISHLRKSNRHDAIKRNIVRLLQDIEIPKKCQVDLVDLCFKYLELPNEAPAVKVFSMTVPGNLAKKYPEIKPELKWLIGDQLPFQTAGFKRQGKENTETVGIVLTIFAEEFK